MSAKRTRNRVVACLANHRKEIEAQAWKETLRKCQEETAAKQQREEFAKTHPVTAGVVPMTTYQEPAFGYKR